MKGLLTKENVGRWSVAVLYLLLCVFYFSPIEAPYKLVYPLSLLTVASLWGHTPLLTVALACSALGDLFGAMGTLLPQMGAFAVAQVCYLVLLCSRVAKCCGAKKVASAAIVPLLFCIMALVGIIPAVEADVIRVGAVVYALLIGTMTTAAALSKSQLVRIGAFLFMLSDFILAYVIFVNPNPPLLKVSLALYFAGQVLLWGGVVGENTRPLSTEGRR